MGLEDKTIQELRQLARGQKLSGYSRLTKIELIRLLEKDKTSGKTSAASEPAKPAATGGVFPAAQPERRAQARPAPKSPQSQLANGNGGAQEQLVEDLKFALAPPGVRALPAEPLPDLGEDIEQLPALGESFLCLLPQKPGILHGYWTLPPNTLKQQSDMKLRLCVLDGEKLRVVQEVAVPSDRGHWYFHVDGSVGDGAVFLQIGHYRNGDFIIAIRRGIARIPSLYASRREDRAWWVSAEQFKAMYERAGGEAEGTKLGWPPSSSFSSR